MARRHEVPTHLNVEDKAFFGLSVRQTMNLTGGAAGTYGLWNQWPDMPLALRVTLAVLSLLLALAFTLVRVYGRGLDEWLFILLHYVTTPKACRWQTSCLVQHERRTAETAWEELNPAVSWEASR